MAVQERAQSLPAADALQGGQARTRIESPGRRALRRFLRHRLAVISLIFMVVVTLVVFPLAPVVAPIAPEKTDLRAVRSEARFADGSAVEAPTADGYWFVRLAFTAASPMPTIVVSYDAGGRQVGRIDADDLRRSIAGGLAGPPNLAG